MINRFEDAIGFAVVCFSLVAMGANAIAMLWEEPFSTHEPPIALAGIRAVNYGLKISLRHFCCAHFGPAAADGERKIHLFPCTGKQKLSAIKIVLDRTVCCVSKGVQEPTKFQLQRA